MEKIFINLGNFFFRWRDTLFTLILMFGLYSLTITSCDLFFYFNGKEWDIFFSFVGFLLILIGVFIRIFTIAFIYIKRAGIQKKIYADTLFQDGLFAHSRNPLYLGNLFIVTGIILSFNVLLLWFFFLPLFYFIYFCIIKAEEHFLMNQFGDRYKDYVEKVPRLFFANLSELPDSFKNLQFSFRQVIKVEHSSHFLIFLSWILINLLKFHYRYSYEWNDTAFYFLYVFLGIVVIYQIFSYFYKKFLYKNV